MGKLININKWIKQTNSQKSRCRDEFINIDKLIDYVNIIMRINKKVELKEQKTGKQNTNR